MILLYRVHYYSDYQVLSEFTVALLEDSGWYKANYTALHELNQFPLRWGEGMKLNLLNDKMVYCLYV